MFEDKLANLERRFKEVKWEEQISAEEFRLQFLSKKGLLSELINDFGTLAADQKREFGKKLNSFKATVTLQYNELLARESKIENNEGKKGQDLGLPGKLECGALHPLTLTQRRIEEVFKRMGFNIVSGPEVESDWFNFSALNFAEDHPARDMQDTFFVTDKYSLRTHTSSVQVRVMESQKPPIRKIMPGRVYRNEAVSARANCFFHQVEGLVIDERSSVADMKKTLYHFVQNLFGLETKVRFRASYFPFTEPSAEMDISCPFCTQRGCNICKYSGWIEIMGCGMVDKAVLENCGIDAEVYQGYAFGMGVDRIAMATFGINDIRDLFNNDERILRQNEKIFS